MGAAMHDPGGKEILPRGSRTWLDRINGAEDMAATQLRTCNKIALTCYGAIRTG